MKMNSFAAICLSIFAIVSSASAQAVYQVPPNDNFKDRITLYGTSIITTGDNILATVETNEPYVSYGTEKTIWWTWTAPVDGSVTISTTHSNFSAECAVYKPITFYGDVIYPQIFIDSGPTVTFMAVKGQTYNIQALGGLYFYTNDPNNVFSGVGLIELDIIMSIPAPANDNFANKQLISGAGGDYIGTNIGATREPFEPKHFGNKGGESVWYSWTAPRRSQVSMKVTGSDFDPVLGVYVVGGKSQLFDVRSDIYTPKNTSTATELNFKAASGQTYMIAVDGDQGKVGNFTLTVAQGPVISLAGGLNFGAQKVNSRTKLNLQITNLGTDTLKIRGIKSPKGYDGRYKGNIGPGRTKIVRVQFHPNSTGIFNGTLLVQSNSLSGTNKISVTGSGF